MITDTLSLKNAIASYAHRTDLTQVMDLFIDAATERLGVDLKAIENEFKAVIVATLPGGPGIPYYVLPADFREMRKVTAPTSDRILEPLGVFDTTWDIPGTALGYVIAASLAGGHIIQILPATAEDIAIDYWAIPAALVSDTDTNPVLLAYSNIYLAACMVEYAAYSINAEMSILWDAKYKAGVQAANDRATKARYGVGLAKSAPARWYNNAPVRAM